MTTHLMKLFSKNNLTLVSQERLFRIPIVISSLLLLIAVVFLFAWQRLPPQLPLFYSLPRGEEQLGSKLSFFLLPLISFFVGIINLFLAMTIFEQYPFASKLLLWTSLAVSFLIGLTFLKIVILIL